MNGARARRYTLLAGAVAVAAAAVAVPAIVAHGNDATWAWIGWAVIAIPGVVGGGLMALRHGTSGPGFFVALGAVVLGRLFAGAAGAGAAYLAGESAVWPYVGGLVAGFVPLQVFEIVWFYLAGQKQPRKI